MSIDLRISDKPFIADILFKDGTRRRLDYSLCNMSGGFFQFFEQKEGSGPTTFVNADLVAVLELNEAAQPVGRA